MDGKAAVFAMAEVLDNDIKKAFEADGKGNIKTEKLRADMSNYSANMRAVARIKDINAEAKKFIADFFDEYKITSTDEIPQMLKKYDSVITTAAVTSAMALSAERYGNRGSCMTDNNDALTDRHKDENCVIVTSLKNGSYLRPVRSIPERDGWFETTWADYLKRTGKK